MDLNCIKTLVTCVTHNVYEIRPDLCNEPHGTVGCLQLVRIAATRTSAAVALLSVGRPLCRHISAPAK
jgi:hypothetical protein